jgi:pimeloyl-ACP methyl ester carboxylesterase
MISIPAIALMYVALVLLFSLFAYFSLFRPLIRDLEFTKNYCIEHGDFDKSMLDRGWEEISIQSPHGYRIAGTMLKAPDPTAPTALFIHGITWTRFGMFKYMKSFIDRGWNVAAIDLPGHGATKAPRRFSPTYGFREKDDVAVTLTFLKGTFPKTSKLGLVGESLGAGTVLQYGPVGAPLAKKKNEAQEREIDFIVADSPFSSAYDELLAQTRRICVPNFIGRPACLLVSLYTRIFRGFFLGSASPAKAILSTDLPILFIHGMEDRYVPTMMSISLVNSRKKAGTGRTDLLLVPGASHVKSYSTDSALWEKTVFDFIAGV